jgi:uncharacterized membrane protein YphA (DoxX/SURF4 family)
MRQFEVSRGLFAVACASLALFNLAYGGLAIQPVAVLRTELWNDGSAVLVCVASIGLCFARTALPAALTIVAYLTIRTLTCTAQILAKPLSIDGWYGFSESLTALVGACILYFMLRAQSRTPRTPIAGERLLHAARFLFGLTCIFYGWSHFVYADHTASMVPQWLPGHLGFAYFTGLAHCAAGAGIIVGVLPRLAATLEATMMSLFGLLVWVPSFFANPPPVWATPAPNQWSELMVTLLLAASAWIVATSWPAPEPSRP